MGNGSRRVIQPASQPASQGEEHARKEMQVRMNIQLFVCLFSSDLKGEKFGILSLRLTDITRD